VARERIKVGDVRLAVDRVGSGPPVILLHGFPELAYSWRYQLPALDAAGFEAIAPDLRGYGDSDRPKAVDDYAIVKLAGDVVGLIDAVGQGSAHLVGHDWGGSLAWVTAALRPELVRSLTILNSPHPVASAEARQILEQQQKSWYMLLFQFAGVAEAWLSNDDFANLRSTLYGTAREGAISMEDEEVFIDALREEGALTAALNYYRANIPPSSWLKPPPDLPPITVPCHIIWGEADAYMGEILLERSIGKIDGEPRVTRLPGVSHWVQQEAPDQVNAALISFIQGLS
jgi:pimeloyl-ACP methyl ester carboxylesterase